ncbi:MAG: EAL domain-containing protein [Lachnospiraceae bacterium]|nr:EAL domain-containing protein [Lachnospiraceae bacterium]
MRTDRRKCALIIDDAAINREILKEILKDEMDIMEAADGSTGLEILKDNLEDIDIVLLDLIMPGVLDGFGVLSEMKREHITDYVPVIMISSDSDTANMERAYDLGALDYITRPYAERIVRRRVLTTVDLYQRQRELAASIDRQYKADKNDVDSLTGLTYKQHFFHLADTRLKDGVFGKLWMIAMDIDHFKLFNSYYAWEAGDIYLKQIGECLQQVVQRYGGIAGYLGGDDFVLLCPARDGILDEIHTYATQLLETNSFELSFAPKYGVYELNASDNSAKETYDKAAIALETIKGNYTKSRALYDSEMVRKAKDEIHLLKQIQKGIREGEFTFYLQPKVDMESGKIIGAEALARWYHDGKVIMPESFIPVLERNGFISTLDREIWKQVAIWCRKRLDEGRIPVTVSVNVSKVDIYTMNVAEYLKELSETYDLPPHLTEIEISEEAFTRDSEKLHETLSQLHEYGFTVCMDDFGQGYSSLNSLRSSDIDSLKVDAYFLNHSEENLSKSVNILKSILDMASQLRLPVILEGIETEEQAKTLQQIGCTYAQGYLYGRAVPIEEMEEKLADAENISMTGICCNDPQGHKIRELFKTDLLTDEIIQKIFGSVFFLHQDEEGARVTWSMQDYYEENSLADLVEFNSAKPLSARVSQEDEDRLYQFLACAIDRQKEGVMDTFDFPLPDGTSRKVLLKLFYLRSTVKEKVFFGAMMDLGRIKGYLQE